MRAEQARPPHEHKEGETEEEHAKAHAEIPESNGQSLTMNLLKLLEISKPPKNFEKKLKEI